MPEFEGRTLGNYHLIEKIGRGGMSSVYKAQDLISEKTVAIKVLAPHLNLDDNFKVRFEREAKVLIELRHPHIIPIIDYGEVEGVMYIVMPFMRVGGLHHRLERGPMSVKEGARIIDQISVALQYAHDMGVVHRDVKPSNILLDEEGNAFLSDFGFAHISDATLSLTGSAVIGTPAYMSPEQIHGEKVTPLSDQYALGVVLYRMSTGYLPFDAETPIAIALKHATEPLPRPRVINPNLPDSVENVLLKVLAKDPTRRYDSVADFNRAFHVALKQAIEGVKQGLSPEIPTEALSTKLDGSLVQEQSKPIPARTPSRTLVSRLTRRPALVVAVLAALIACPLTVWALATWIPSLLSGGSGVALSTSPTIDVQGTLEVFGTQIAGTQGMGLSQDEMMAFLAASLTAQAAETELGLPFTGDDATATELALMGSPAGGTPTTGGMLVTDTSYGEGGSSSPTSAPGGSSPVPTNTALSASSNTPPPSAASNTPVPPTNTLPPPPTASNTPVPPTNTLPPPPTATTENVCANLSLGGKTVLPKKVTWTFKNNSSITVTISYVRLAWPEDPDNVLLRIKVGDANFSVNDGSSPTEKSGVGVAVAPGGSARIQFEFEADTNASSYSLTVKTTNGCTK